MKYLVPLIQLVDLSEYIEVDFVKTVLLISLELIGRAPTRDEVGRFMDMDMAGSAPDRRAQLVDELLASEDFAEHWAQRWADRLLPGDKRAQREASEPLESYLSYVRNPVNGYASVTLPIGDTMELSVRTT